MKFHKKILLVSSEFPPQPGGIGDHTFNLANQFSLNSFEVTVLVDCRSESGIEEKVFDKKLPFLVERILVKKQRWKMYVKRISMLFSIIKKYDIIIASGKFSLWAVAFVSLFYKKKHIAIIHGSEVNFTSFLNRTLINNSLKRFQKIIAVSNYTKSLIAHLKINNIVVIPNGYNLEKWEDKNEEKIIVKGNPNLITVGNVTQRKGQLNVIKLLPEIIKKYPNLQYHCVGIPTEKEYFLSEAKRLEVDKHIIFYGRVSVEKLQQLLMISDICVMLSGETKTGDVEGFGIAILEANALGIPAIGSKNCGIEDAISENNSGILISNTSSEEFINAIDKISSNYAHFSLESKKWAAQHTWDIIIKKYLKVLD